MQKNVLIALAIVGTLTAGFFLLRNKPTTTTETSALKDVYNQWKVEYKINVGAAEDDLRFKIFSTNYGKIQLHNSKMGRSYSLGLNAFTHLTQEEFSATHLGLKNPKKSNNTMSIMPVTDVQTVDWREKMNKVKDQAQCGSCWAFSAIGALEGFHSVHPKGDGKLYNLSEQELVDCSTKYGNMGCNGGLMDYAFQYVIDNKGISLQEEYPYKGVDSKCAKKSTNAAITGFSDVTVNSANDLIAAIAKQPVAVAIEADTFTFQSYKSGVITGKACGTQLDHGVVAVGFDRTTGSEKYPYYIVRNSWGTSWGDKGHVKIGIEEGAGVCGIQQAASYPTRQ